MEPRLNTTLLQPTIVEVDQGGMTCEDCPITNPNPPARSECPDFDNTVEPPVCKRADEMMRKFAQFLGRTTLE